MFVSFLGWVTDWSGIAYSYNYLVFGLAIPSVKESSIKDMS